jgi:hypothetical protein
MYRAALNGFSDIIGQETGMDWLPQAVSPLSELCIETGALNAVPQTRKARRGGRL